MNKIVLASILATLGAPALAADTVSWANWANLSQGVMQQGPNTITVSYVGENLGIDRNAYIYDVPSSFTNAQVTNTPGTNGTILMAGGGPNRVNTFHFSQAVVNPYISVFSVGQNGVPVAFNFQNGATFSILAQGRGHWGGGSLTQTSPSSFVGREGNGLLQFNGTFTDISFITPNSEYYYGATVGIAAAVPEPETYAMMLAGLGLLGAMARRRKNAAKVSL
jgi:PEP-CTERM motif